MELLNSIIVDSTPSLTSFFKLATLQLLKAIKALLLLYPFNVLLFTLALYLVVNRITSRFASKQKFRATYDPLPHHDSPVEQLKLIKKEVREAQADLIALLKQQPPKQPSEPKGEVEAGLSEEMNAFMVEVGEKSDLLQQVENQLKQTVSEAFRQISRINEQ